MSVKRLRLEREKIGLFQIFIVISMFLSATVSEFVTYIFPSTKILMGIIFLAVISMLGIALLWHILNIELFFHIALMLAVYFFHNYYIERNLYYQPLLFVSIIMACYISDRTIKWAEYLLPMLRAAYIFYAVCTVIFYFTPSFYLGTVVNLFPATRSRLIEWYNSGCMPGLTSHYSVNAMYIASGLLIEVSKIFASDRVKKYQILLIMLMAVSLLLTGKRGHIIFVGAAVFVLYWYYNDKKTRMLKALRILIGGICVAAVLFSVFPALSVFIERFQEQISAGNVLTNRGMFWELALRKFLENPITGSGWEQFLSESYEELGIQANVHNIYIQLLYETGIIGFSIYVSWMFIHLKKAVRLFVFARKHWCDIPCNIRSSLIFSLSFQVFFVLYGFTGNPLYDSMVLIPYIIACSITIYYGKGWFQKRKVVGIKSV